MIKEESQNVVESNDDDKDPILSEDLKEEASESLNQVKDIIKNVNIKEEAQNTKGLLLTMWKNPVGELTKVVNDHRLYFKTAVIILCIWAAAEFISGIVYIRYFSYFFSSFSSFIDNMLGIVTETVSPIISVFALSLIVYLLYRDKVGSLIKVGVIVTIACVPRAVAAVIGILPGIISDSSQIVSPISSFLYVLSVVMVYFSLRCLLLEDDESFFKKYMLIQAIFIVAKLVLSFINIYI